MHLAKTLFSFVFFISIVAQSQAMDLNAEKLHEEDTIKKAFNAIDKAIENEGNLDGKFVIEVDLKTSKCLNRILKELSQTNRSAIQHITINVTKQAKSKTTIGFQEFAAFVNAVWFSGKRIHVPFLDIKQTEEYTSDIHPDFC